MSPGGARLGVAVAGLLALGGALWVARRAENHAPLVTQLTLVAGIGSAAAPGSGEPEVAWALAPAPLDWASVKAEPPRVRPDAARGAELFASLCTPCHGAGGRGDGPLAAELPRRPRDLASGWMRTRDRRGVVSAIELYRTLTAGAPFYGMPSFASLSEADRWAIVSFLTGLRRGRVDWTVSLPETLRAPERGGADPELGRTAFRSRGCALCHGERGDGGGAQGIALLDDNGERVTPAPFARGPEAFRAGTSVEAIARSVLLGRASTPMKEHLELSSDELWAVARYVARLASEGSAERRARWSSFFEGRRARATKDAVNARPGPEEERFDAAISDRFARSPAGKHGCLSCHEGVAPIASGRMALAVAAVAGGDPDRGCTVCHEGTAAASEKAAAHAGLIPNPGSLWVTSVGGGCAKCHSDRGALTTLEGEPLPEPAGGRLLQVTSKKTDPTGASGRNHAYRIQRALMAQETGKVYLGTATAGVVERDAPRFTDFAIDDPDGPVPCAGSADYRAFIARALAKGQVKRFERGEALPTYEKARALLGGDAAAAGYVDAFRKDCVRCHLWGEGAKSRGERRSSGCSACHVLNDEEHTSDTADPTIPRDRPGHALRHELVLAPPESQCNHCHTRGFWTKHSDNHQKAGLGCGDCHTSIDVHGDGNIYPSIKHQLEVRCEDCHGTPTRAPWDLPVGEGTAAPSSSSRGVFEAEGRKHLLTARGNVRTNWLREGESVVVESFYSGERHKAPLLRDSLAADTGAVASSAPAHNVAKHEALACSACHGSTGPRCGTCHLSYSRYEVDAVDPILSARRYDPATTRASTTFTPGKTFTRDAQGMPQGDPEMRPDGRGRLAPHIRGCRVAYSFRDEAGKPGEFAPRMNPGREGYPPPVAPTLSHENSLRARDCAECHLEGTTGPVTLPGEERK